MQNCFFTIGLSYRILTRLANLIRPRILTVFGAGLMFSKSQTAMLLSSLENIKKIRPEHGDLAVRDGLDGWRIIIVHCHYNGGVAA